MINNGCAQLMWMYKGFRTYDLVAGKELRYKSGYVCVKREGIMRQSRGLTCTYAL
jgi:hypothetical protein